MRTLFVSIPMGDICMPPLGISSLKGFLVEHGISSVKCCDLNLAFLYYCTDTLKLEKCGVEAKKKLADKSRDMCIEENLFFNECCLNARYICENIENTLMLLKETHGYESSREYKKHSSIIARALKLFSVVCYPTLVTPSGVFFQSSANNWDSVEHYIRDNSQNPLIRFYEDLLPHIVDSDTEYLGISVNYFDQIIPSITLARIMKEQYPGIKVIFGGALFPDYKERLSDLDVFAKYSDALIMFAGEYPWYMILRENHLYNIPGCMYSINGTYIQNSLTIPETQRVKPDFSDYNLKEYITPQIILPYTMSAGCYWGNCQFCGYQFYKDPCLKKFDKTYYKRSVYTDLMYFNLRYGATAFYFVDEAMPADIGEKLADEIILNKSDFIWYSEFRFDRFLTYEYLQHLKEGGCTLIFFGLESGNDRVLTAMRKGIDSNTVEKILQDCEKVGIKTMPMLFFGFPTETIEEATDTINLLKRRTNAIAHIGVGTFVLLRNIPIYFEAEKYGINIISKRGELVLDDNYSVKHGMSPNDANMILNKVHGDEILSKYFDYILLSRSHLLFFENQNESSSINVCINSDSVYVLRDDCQLICIEYNLFTGEKSSCPENYLFDFEKNCFYFLSRYNKELLEQYLKDKMAYKNTNCKVKSLLRYFIEKGIIVEYSE